MPSVPIKAFHFLVGSCTGLQRKGFYTWGCKEKGERGSHAGPDQETECEWTWDPYGVHEYYLIWRHRQWKCQTTPTWKRIINCVQFNTSMLKPVQLNSVLSVEFNRRGIGIGVTNWQYYAHLWLAATSLTIGWDDAPWWPFGNIVWPMIWWHLRQQIGILAAQHLRNMFAILATFGGNFYQNIMQVWPILTSDRNQERLLRPELHWRLRAPLPCQWGSWWLKMDGWWPRSGSYMGQKARIRRSLSKDGQRTEVDRDEEGGTKIRRCFNVDGGGEDRERKESKKISGVKRKEKSETEGGLSMRRRGRSSTECKYNTDGALQ